MSITSATLSVQSEKSYTILLPFTSIGKLPERVAASTIMAVDLLVVLNRVEAFQLPAGSDWEIVIDGLLSTTAGVFFTVIFTSAHSDWLISETAVSTVVPVAAAVNVPCSSIVPTEGSELYHV